MLAINNNKCNNVIGIQNIYFQVFNLHACDRTYNTHTHITRTHMCSTHIYIGFRSSSKVIVTVAMLPFMAQQQQ